jgi:hypothetical protein
MVHLKELIAGLLQSGMLRFGAAISLPPSRANSLPFLRLARLQALFVSQLDASTQVLSHPAGDTELGLRCAPNVTCDGADLRAVWRFGADE